MLIILNALLEMTVSASAMIGIAFVIRACFSKKMNPAVMLSLWIIVLVRLCLPVTIASPIHVTDLIPKLGSVVEPEPVYFKMPSKIDPQATMIPTAQVSQLVSAVASPEVDNSVISQNTPKPSLFTTIAAYLNRISILNSLALIWLLGFVVVILYTARKARLFRQKLCICRPIEKKETLHSIMKHSLNMGVNKNIKALECDFVQVPTVFGYYKPIILLPRAFIDHMEDYKLDIILLHEICHIKRHDMLMNYIWLFAKALHWFNPLVWIAYKLFQDDTELCRDQMVINNLDHNERLDYGQTLVDSTRYARRIYQHLPSVTASLFENRSKVKERVIRMFEPQKRSKPFFVASVMLAMLMLVACFTTACQPSPTGEIVKNKSKDNFLNGLVTSSAQVTAGATGSDIGANNVFVNYTKSWKDTIQVKPHKITVNIDAKVVTPVTDKLPVYTVSPEKVTQDQVNNFLSQFGNVQYHLNPLIKVKTKSDYQKMILDLQKQLAELPNNKNYTDSQKKTVKKELEDGLKNEMSLLETAPESLDDVIDPVFTDKYIISYSDQPEILVDPGATSTPAGKSAKEQYQSTHTEAIDVKWDANDVPMTLDIHRSDSLGNNSFIYSANQAEYLSMNIIENTSNLNGLQTTYEQAKKAAGNAVAKLRLNSMTIAESAKGIKYTDLPHNLNLTDTSHFTDFSKLQYSDMAYVFYFTTSINNVSETYCSNGISQDQYSEPWPYVNLCVVVDDSGVREISWQSTGLKIGEKLSEDSKLLPFDQIQKIAKQQFSDGNIDFGSYGFVGSNFKGIIKIDLNIDKVVLGYTRVKLSDNSGKYVLVPTWDFFGSFAAASSQDKGLNQYSKQADSVNGYDHSYLTINAIDGSVIDRSLGY